MPHLGYATGMENFHTICDGIPIIERPEQGEVIWQDEHGVTCRRWNWRQCKRTGLSARSENLWFVIDRLEPMPMDALHRAGEELVAGLRRLCPSIETAISLLAPHRASTRFSQPQSPPSAIVS
jgi:DNA/RNA-binding domain of Phe-tRNA-synthetase-like protein